MSNGQVSDPYPLRSVMLVQGRSKSRRYASLRSPMATTYGNAWGCRVQAQRGHSSSTRPGEIAAKAVSICNKRPPFQIVKHHQYLARSSWRGWITVDPVDGRRSHCPGNSWKCLPPRNRKIIHSVIAWDCVDAGFEGAAYNYRNTVYGQLKIKGVWYYDTDTNWSGPSNAPGEVVCES